MCCDRVVLKKLLVPQKMRSSKVSGNEQAEESEAAGNNLVILEESDNVENVGEEGCDTEEQEWKRHPVPHTPEWWGFMRGILIVINLEGQVIFFQKAPVLG